MGLADDLRNMADQRLKEIQEEAKRDAATEYFEEIVKECAEEAQYGRKSIVYGFPGYFHSWFNCDRCNNPPVNKVAELLRKEGFLVYIKEREITNAEVYGYRAYELDFWDKRRKKLEDYENTVIGRAFALEISW